MGYRVKKDSPWEGTYLKDIRQSEKENQFLIASIVRDGKSSIPTGQDQIRLGDYVYILIPRQIADALNNILNVRISSNRKAIIAGENLIAQRVANGLIKSHYTVTMICRDELSTGKMRRKYSNKKKFTVIHGDSESVKVQLKADVAVSALFVAVSGDDHLNIASGMVARYLGAAKTIAVVNRQDLVRCAEKVDIDVTISPRLSTARQIKKIIRGREQSLNYTTISETNMEVMEMVTGESSPILHTPLKDVKLPQNTLVGALIKGKNKAIIPSGETTIESGDKVIMVTMPENVPRLKEILEGKDNKVGNAI